MGSKASEGIGGGGGTVLVDLDVLNSCRGGRRGGVGGGGEGGITVVSVEILFSRRDGGGGGCGGGGTLSIVEAAERNNARQIS
jgi:hypothetical protein